MYEQIYNPYARNVAIIKKYFNNTSVLILAILQFVSVALSLVTVIVSAVISAPLMQRYAESLVQYFGDSLEFSGTDISVSVSGSGFSSVLSMIPGLAVTVLLGVALLLVYTKSRNPDPNVGPKAGFTILFVLSIIGLVGTAVSFALIAGLLALFIAVTAIFGYYPGGAGMGQLGELQGIAGFGELFPYLMIIYIAVFAILLVYMALVLIYSINRVRYLSGIRSSMSSVNLSNKGACGYGVMCVIFAVFSALSSLGILCMTVLFNLFSSALGEYAFVTELTPLYIITALASVVSLLYYIFEAKLALGYKKYIHQIKNGYDEPAPETPGAPTGGYPTAPQPVYAPEPDDAPAPLPQAQTQPQTPRVNPQPIPQPTTNPDLIAPKICPNCGSQIDGDSAFCNICGYRVP